MPGAAIATGAVTSAPPATSSGSLRVVLPGDDAAQKHELRSEALGLAAGEPRELGAADPVGETEEVLDQRRVRRLPARHVTVEHQVYSPSEAAYTAAARPAGPAPTIARS